MHLINTSKSYPAVGPYSQAVRVGDLIYYSGVVGIDPLSGSIDPDFRTQTLQVFANLKSMMSEMGASLADVVKTSCFLTDMSMFSLFNELYATEFGEHRPARSTLGVASLPKGALVEIEIVSVAPISPIS